MSKKGGRRGHLAKALDSHIKNIQETFQILDKPAASSLDKVDWPEVIKLGDEVSKQATIAGMLWNGEAREMKELEENMEAYFNVLQGFLLICHGSTVGAGSTLHASICTSAKHVVDCSLSLLREAVSSYGKTQEYELESGITFTMLNYKRNPSGRLTIPQLAGSVWEACAALKKTPTSNCTAIARAITQVALSVKDVLREMREIKPTADAGPSDVTGQLDANQDELDDSFSDGGLGDDLSPEEMVVVQLVVDVTATSLDALKELIRFLSGLLKSPNIKLDTKEFTELLERLLGYCKEIGSEVSELGACVYPPQEVSEIKTITKKIVHGVGKIRREIESIESPKENLFTAFQAAETALGKLESGLAGDPESEMDRLAL